MRLFSSLSNMSSTSEQVMETVGPSATLAGRLTVEILSAFAGVSPGLVHRSLARRLMKQALGPGSS